MSTATADLTVRDALNRILAEVAPLPIIQLPLADALGSAVAEAVYAREPMPPFANSAMDGYALRAADLATIPATLNVIGDIPAGQAPQFTIQPGTAARIMTGAPMPAGADAVVPVEATNEQWRAAERPLPKTITINRQVETGAYVRLAGEDMAVGTVALPAGQTIRPQEIGILAMLGIAHVPVYRQPLVGILATGDELVEIDQPLTPGTIRNSNGYTQAAQVVAAGGKPLLLGIAADNEADVRRKLQQGIDAGVDFFVSSAGVSVGAYDVVKAVLEAEGVVGFWRVRMRPGKPLAFGRYRGIPYAGLPGNPVSAMLSFDTFVRPALRKMAGHTELQRQPLPVQLLEPLHSDGRQTYFRVIITHEEGRLTAKLAGGQESNMMQALAHANGLLILPEGQREAAAGSWLTALLL